MDRLRDAISRDADADHPGTPEGPAEGSAAAGGTRERPDQEQEAALRARLEADPNDQPAFTELADLVRRHAAEGHEVDPASEGAAETAARVQHEADDAVWALAEEMARSGRAWYPLLELARLSLPRDRDGALRRLATAVDRDASGRALGEALALLRGAGMPADALNLGVGHWRPKEHDPEVGRQLVQAAVEAGRTSEARRYLAAFAQYPDQERAARVRADLEALVGPPTGQTGQFTAIDPSGPPPPGARPTA